MTNPLYCFTPQTASMNMDTNELGYTGICHEMWPVQQKVYKSCNIMLYSLLAIYMQYIQDKHQ